MSEEPIAVVGMACRFPGADGLSGYWELLEHGRSAIGPVPEERLHALPVEEHPGMRVGGFLESVYDFDWSAFRIGPREAKWMDPQHRLLLEVAWEALEDGGIPVDSLDEQCTGVFIGSSWNDYHRLHSGDLEAVQGHLASGVPPAFAANRISHCFDARGPSFTVDASCASALAALHQACQALRTGACERVVVGAASLMLAPDNFVMLARAGLLSRHGRVMALDRDADGFARGEGAGVLILKPQRHVSAQDRVYCWIRGCALNHVGRTPWIMAPSDKAQAQVLRAALVQAGREADQLDYVELHGTGFKKGDEVEVRAVGSALGRADGSPPCAVGSVKTNVGHLEAASGIASLIKVALMLHHRMLVPTRNLKNTNPSIEFASMRVEPQRELEPLSVEGRLPLAGVSAVSFSGTNAHAILEAAPATDMASEVPVPGFFVLPMSARTENSLASLVARTRQWLQAHVEVDASELVSICYTAGVRRAHHKFRAAVVGASARELVLELVRWSEGSQRPVVPAKVAGATALRTRAGADALARAYEVGASVRWDQVYPQGRCLSLPAYPWQRETLLSPALSGLQAGGAPRGAERAGDRSAPVAAVQMREQALLQDPNGLWRLPEERLRRTLRHMVSGHLAEVLQVSAERIEECHEDLFELGLSSLLATAFVERMGQAVGMSLPRSLLLECRSLDRLVQEILTTGLGVEAGGGTAEAKAMPPTTGTLDVVRMSEMAAEEALMERLAALEARR